MSWRTKPSDRFILRFIKLHLSAPVTRVLVRMFPDLRPAVVTLLSTTLGVTAGVFFGLGVAWLGGLLAAVAQVFDGVDGQVARLCGRTSSEGALLDSVLDRYVDFSLMFGMLLHALRFSTGAVAPGLVITPAALVVLTGLAAVGASQVSYSTARAASLGLDHFRRPEYAGKGTRTAVVIICGLLTPLWVHSPLVALLYLAVHPNLAVLGSLARAARR